MTTHGQSDHGTSSSHNKSREAKGKIVYPNINPLSVLPYLDAIVIGAGPSYGYLLSDPPPFDKFSPFTVTGKPKLYGAGVVSRFFPLDVYALGDYDNIKFTPTYPCKIVCSAESLQIRPDIDIWPQHPYGHGASSGGMALTLACMDHEKIGIIGFDGFTDWGMSVANDWPPKHRWLLQKWLGDGKQLVSLMPCSIFNDLLITPEAFLHHNEGGVPKK